MATRSTINRTALKKQLLAQRQEILADAQSSEQARQPVELDQTSVGRLSRMDALQDQAMALETDRRAMSNCNILNRRWRVLKMAASVNARIAVKLSPRNACK